MVRKKSEETASRFIFDEFKIAKKFTLKTFFPKNLSFSESCFDEIAYVLEALRFLAISYLRKNLKNTQNHHVSIKNAYFLYEKTQSQVSYTKNRPNLGLFCYLFIHLK